MPAKSKLTLSVDTETIEKAKRLGINISEITEKVLKTFTFSKDETRYEIQKGFETLLRAMMPLLKEYKATMEVGTAAETPEDPRDALALTGYGFEFADDPQGVNYSLDQVEVQSPFISFLAPDTLLKNFIDALSSAKAMRQERVRSLELAREIVEAITKDMSSKGTKAAPRARGLRRGGRIG